MNQLLNYQPNLKKLYREKIIPEIMKEYSLKNIHQVPSIQKISVNVGIGRGKDDKKLIEAASNTLRKITSLNPLPTKSKKSIASFKLREGNIIGLKVTLRGDRMYEFLDRLINIVLPRQRDFHGVKIKAFDKQGNYSIGFDDQSVFPELSFEETVTNHGLEVNIVLENSNTTLSKSILEKFGLPFEKEVK